MSQDNGHDGAGAAARFAERAVGERSESGRARGFSAGVADPELIERASRRKFVAQAARPTEQSRGALDAGLDRLLAEQLAGSR